MADTTISGLPDELLGSDVDPVNDMLEIDDVDAGLTKRISPKSLVDGGGAVMDADFAGSDAGALARTGVGTYAVRKDNLAAAATPTANDDETQGYSVGSRWIVPGSAGGEWVCTEAKAAAAVWAVTTGDIELSDDAPLSAGTATAGDSDEAARANHVHPAGGTVVRSTTGGSAELLETDVIVEVDTSADGDSNVALPGGTGAHTWLITKTSTDDAALTLQPADAETIQGVAAAYMLPGSRSAAHPAWLVYRDAAGAIWVVSLGAPGAAVGSEAGTSRTLADADDNTVIRCLSAVTVTITVPALQPGVTVELVQEDSGQVQLVGDTGITLRHPATFHPYTAEQWSSVVVTMLDASTALVRGDLAAV